MQEMKTNKPCYKWTSNSTRGLDRLSKHWNFKSVSFNVRGEKNSIDTKHDIKECRIWLRLVGMQKDNLARNSFRKWNCSCDWLKLGKEYQALNLSWRERCLYFLYRILRNLFMKNECKILRMRQHNLLLGTPALSPFPLSSPHLLPPLSSSQALSPPLSFAFH